MLRTSNNILRQSVTTPCVLFLAIATNVWAEEWKGIHPLRSTRVDVEKILGKCSNSEKLAYCLHERADENILIEYSVGTACGEIESFWNVPDGTVLKIVIHRTDGGLPFKDLPFDLNEFVQEEDRELPGQEHFTKQDVGLVLEARGGLIQSLYYGPSGSDRKRFKCKRR